MIQDRINNVKRLLETVILHTNQIQITSSAILNDLKKAIEMEIDGAVNDGTYNAIPDIMRNSLNDNLTRIIAELARR